MLDELPTRTFTRSKLNGCALQPFGDSQNIFFYYTTISNFLTSVLQVYVFEIVEMCCEIPIAIR